MNKPVFPNVFLLICLFLLVANCLIVEVETCSCEPSGEIVGKEPPPGACNPEDSYACCAEGEIYNIYNCSPHVSSRTKANLTLRSLDRGGDGGPPPACDYQNHLDTEIVVALSTGWLQNKTRCLRFINIHGNGKKVKAKVVDQCDSTVGCDEANRYAPPCGNNIVQATEAVWDALEVPQSQWGVMEIHWSDAKQN